MRGHRIGRFRSFWWSFQLQIQYSQPFGGLIYVQTKPPYSDQDKLLSVWWLAQETMLVRANVDSRKYRKTEYEVVVGGKRQEHVVIS